MDRLHITLNGQAHALPAGSTLQQALAQLMPLASASSPVATAVNGEYVARGARAHTVLREGDQITTFEPITGG